MSGEIAHNRSWGQVFAAWTHPRVIAMLFLGFSAGIPLLLIFSTLSVWLSEAGASRSEVTFFSWAALGYSFKFVWAPLVDLMPLPFLTRKLGRRRAWLLLAQVFIMVAISWMAMVNPAAHPGNLTLMAFAAVLLGFSAATQDIVIDAYRIESVDQSMQALLASMYIAGYRIGMLVAGAGSLLLASHLGTSKAVYDYASWRTTYLTMALVVLVGVVTTLTIAEPAVKKELRYVYTPAQYRRLFALFVLTAGTFALTFFAGGANFGSLQEDLRASFPLFGQLASFAVEICRFAMAAAAAATVAWCGVLVRFVEREMVVVTYAHPVQDFFHRYGVKPALLILALVGFYRLSDVVLGVVANVFYLDMGFSKEAMAYISQTFGLGMTLLGGFLGGMLTLRFGVNSILFLGAFLSAVTNLLFMLLAGAGADVAFLTVVIAADNLSAGLATTAFVAFLSSLTSISFTAVQYAIFSSVMTLMPKLMGGYSGSIVTAFGYETFFMVTALMGIPVLVLVWLVRRAMVVSEEERGI
jgi:MFS transporter, PAT family, beta-lactamase induction signal transducer AmpG